MAGGLQQYASEHFTDTNRLANGGYSPGFTKTGLLLWLKADSITGVSEGGTVSSWFDSSGNGNNAGASGTPSYHAAVVNGLPIVRFDGASDFYTFGDFLTGAGSAYEAFTVMKTDNDPPATANSGLWAMGSATASDHYPYSDSSLYSGFCSTARKNTGNPSPSLAVWHIQNVWSASSDFGLYLNNASHYTTATNTVGVTASPKLGQSAGAYEFDGDMAEILIYSRKLGSGERQEVHVYLSTRYNISIS